jgi:uncharacterized protein (DUF488 family)
MRTLYTIGYEGAQLDTFLDKLRDVGAVLLIDVRALPLSRRKGFSKTRLRDSLSATGIDYFHVRELGAPKAIRENLRRTGDYATYFRHFGAYLKTQTTVLQALAKRHEGVVVLMCYERDPSKCHRSMVAREVGFLSGVTPVHLQVEEPHGRIPAATILHSRKGIPAGQPKV